MAVITRNDIGYRTLQNVIECNGLLQREHYRKVSDTADSYAK